MKQARRGIGHKITMKAYIFTFTYGGKEYTVKDLMYLSSGLEKEFQVGDKVSICINPIKPEEFYRSRPGAFILTGILGLSALFAGILILSLT